MEPTPSSRLLGGSVEDIPPPAASADNTTGPLYNEESKSGKIFQAAFLLTVVLMVIITVILSIYRAVEVGKKGTSGGIYFLLGASLLGFVAIELLMVRFVRNGDLPREKTWFLYFVGGCTVLESIFTDVLLFQ